MKFEDLEEKRRQLNRPSLRTLKNWKDIVGVEIGVQYGVNARDILERFDVQKLYLVDPYVPYLGVNGKVTEDNHIEIKEIAHDYLKDFEDKIVWVENFSWNVANILPDNLDFVYIDGNHNYDPVKRDLTLYYPKIRSGGLIAIHDYDNRAPGVVDAVNEFFGNLEKQFEYGGKWDAWSIK